MSKQIIAWDFGSLGEREIEVEFAYTPAHGDGWNEPREDEEFEIEGITMEGKDIYWMFGPEASEEVVEAIIEARS